MSNLHPRAGAVLLGVIVLMSVGVAAATTVTVGGGVTYQTDSGLNVTVSYDHQLGLSNPFGASDSVTVVNTTVSGNGGGVTIDDASGEYLNLSGIDATTNTISVDGASKDPIQLSGGVDAIDISDVSIDDSETQFVYSASSSGNVTLTGLQANTAYRATNGSRLIDVGVTDSNGETTVALDAATDETVIIATNDAPTVDNQAASPTGSTTNKTVQFEIPVNDTDFSSGDRVEVNISVDGSVVNTQTIESGRTVTYSQEITTGGQHTWQATATDAAGQTVRSDGDVTVSGDEPFEFELPASLGIRPIANTSDTITGANVSVTFFGSNTVATRTDPDNDGKIDFSGLPLDERFEAAIEADGFVDRTVVVASLFEQQDVYMLNDSAPTVRPRFLIDSANQNFPEDNSEIIIERPVTINNTQKYKTITAAQPGISGFDIALEQGQRYRVTVRSPQGDTKQLGAFVPTATEQVVLEIQSSTFDIGDGEAGAVLNAQWLDNDDAQPAVSVDINGPNVIESRLNVTERPNGTVVTDTTTSGSLSTTIPAEAGKSYRVKMTAVRELDDGSTTTVDKTTIVSSGQIDGTGDGVADRWQTLFAFAVLLVVGGLFTKANAGIGAISVAGIGAVFWTIGWLPAAASGLTVAVAMLIGVISYAVRQSRGVPT